MSQTKVIGSAAAAATVALPTTGSPLLTMALVGFAMVAGGLLMLRASRVRHNGI